MKTIVTYNNYNNLISNASIEISATDTLNLSTKDVVDGTNTIKKIEINATSTTNANPVVLDLTYSEAKELVLLLNQLALNIQA